MKNKLIIVFLSKNEIQMLITLLIKVSKRDSVNLPQNVLILFIVFNYNILQEKKDRWLKL